jgi:hypothetical protein
MNLKTSSPVDSSSTSGVQSSEYRSVKESFKPTDAPLTDASGVDSSTDDVSRIVFVSSRRATTTVSLKYRRGDANAALLQRRIKEALQR